MTTRPMYRPDPFAHLPPTQRGEPGSDADWILIAGSWLRRAQLPQLLLDRPDFFGGVGTVEYNKALAAVAEDNEAREPSLPGQPSPPAPVVPVGPAAPYPGGVDTPGQRGLGDIMFGYYNGDYGLLGSAEAQRIAIAVLADLYRVTGVADFSNRATADFNGRLALGPQGSYNYPGGPSATPPVPTAGTGGPGAGTGTTTPTTPMTMKDIYKLGLQQAPEAAFRQFLGGQRGPAAVPFGDRVTNFYAPAAAEAFTLAPWLRSGDFPTVDPLKTLLKYTMPQFMGSPGAGMFDLQSGMIPSPEGIRGALRQAGGPLTGQTPAQQTVGRLLQTPDYNWDVFNMVANPMLAQGGGLFGPMVRKYLQSAFDVFQEEDPSRSFLGALTGGTAGYPFLSMSGFR